MHDPWPGVMVVRILTESLCDARHASLRGPLRYLWCAAALPARRPLLRLQGSAATKGSRHDQGPRGPRTGPWGPCRSAPTSGRRRCREAAPGERRRVWCIGSAPPAYRGRMSGVDPSQGWCAMRGTYPLRAAGRAAPRATDSTGYGRLRASPKPTALGVTGLLSPADRSRTLGRGPTAYLQYATRSSGATRGYFESRPWLARTPGPTKSPWDRSRAVRVRVGPNADTPVQPRDRCGSPTGLTRGRGTAPAASWRARCRACRAHPGTGRGSPSRGRG